MSELVNRLCGGETPIEVTIRPERTPAALKERLDRGYVHIRFTNTRGGTELGVPIDRQRSDLSAADFERAQGQLTLVGALTLDFVRVRCIATIDIATMSGVGRLERVAE